jgi:hypothetical protein
MWKKKTPLETHPSNSCPNILFIFRKLIGAAAAVRNADHHFFIIRRHLIITVDLSCCDNNFACTVLTDESCWEAY